MKKTLYLFVLYCFIVSCGNKTSNDDQHLKKKINLTEESESCSSEKNMNKSEYLNFIVGVWDSGCNLSNVVDGYYKTQISIFSNGDFRELSTKYHNQDCNGLYFYKHDYYSKFSVVNNFVDPETELEVNSNALKIEPPSNASEVFIESTVHTSDVTDVYAHDRRFDNLSICNNGKFFINSRKDEVFTRVVFDKE